MTKEATELLTAKEAARYIGRAPATFHKLVRQGSIAPVQISKRLRRYSTAELDRYMSERSSSSRPSDEATRAAVSQPAEEAIDPYLDRVVQGDAQRLLEGVPDECVHLAVTSPPYNVGAYYDSHQDVMDYDEYRRWLKRIWAETQRVLVTGGRLAINIAPTSIKDFRPVHYDIAADVMSLGMSMRAEILWYKQTIYRRTAWGSWRSPSNPHVMPSWEYVLIFNKGSWKLEGDKEKADIEAEEFKYFSDAFWFIQPETQRKGHPAPFPQELIYRLIKFYTYRENVVLDMFGGTGTVAVVAKKTGRHFLHFDISEEYNAVADERLGAVEPEAPRPASAGQEDGDGPVAATEARRRKVVRRSRKVFSKDSP